jgi:hypothetical protein
LRPNIVVALLATIACVAASCARPLRSSAPAPIVLRETDSAGVIHGIVRDEHGVPIASAELNVKGAPIHAYTDAAGRFRLVVASAQRFELDMRRVGYAARQDSLGLLAGRGLDIVIVVRVAPFTLSYVCTCDPINLVTLRLRRPSGYPFAYAITTVRERDQPDQRDSIPASAFVGDTLSRAIWSVSRAAGTHQTVSVTVRAPGYRDWERNAVALRDTLRVALEPRR